MHFFQQQQLSQLGFFIWDDLLKLMLFIFLIKWSTYPANIDHKVVIIKKEKERKEKKLQAGTLATKISNPQVSVSSHYHTFIVNGIYKPCSKWGVALE